MKVVNTTALFFGFLLSFSISIWTLSTEGGKTKVLLGDEEDEFVLTLPKTNENDVEAKIKMLQEIDIPFYMYDHPNMTLEDDLLTLRGKKMDRYAAEMLFDLASRKMLEESSFRTHDPTKAKLFVVPIPFGMIATSVSQHYYHVALDALVNHTLFKSTYGHNHVLLASPFILFRGDKPKYEHGEMHTWLPHLWNVTVAMSWDQNGLVNAVQDGVDFYEYNETFREMKPLTRRTFSMGLTGGTNFPLNGRIPKLDKKNQLQAYNFPLTMASTEKFYNSSNLIFYHSPKEHKCYHNSTIHRLGPITNITMDDFPKSSIGYEIPDKDEWLKTFKDSKFCLCIRG